MVKVETSEEAVKRLSQENHILRHDNQALRTSETQARAACAVYEQVVQAARAWAVFDCPHDAEARCDCGSTEVRLWERARAAFKALPAENPGKSLLARIAELEEIGKTAVCAWCGTVTVRDPDVMVLHQKSCDKRIDAFEVQARTDRERREAVELRVQQLLDRIARIRGNIAGKYGHHELKDMDQ